MKCFFRWPCFLPAFPFHARLQQSGRRSSSWPGLTPSFMHEKGILPSSSIAHLYGLRSLLTMFQDSEVHPVLRRLLCWGALWRLPLVPIVSDRPGGNDGSSLYPFRTKKSDDITLVFPLSISWSSLSRVLPGFTWRFSCIWILKCPLSCNFRPVGSRKDRFAPLWRTLSPRFVFSALQRLSPFLVSRGHACFDRGALSLFVGEDSLTVVSSGPPLC